MTSRTVVPEEQASDASAHDVERALPELLEEIRIAQMGAQILLGFLLAVAYTSVLQDAEDGDRRLYAVAVVVATGAVVLLLGIVPLHRLNFGLRARPEILELGHVLAVAGLVMLGGAIVLSVLMAARIAMPDLVLPVVVPVVVLVVCAWVLLPLWLRSRAGRERAEGPAPSASPTGSRDDASG